MRKRIKHSTLVPVSHKICEKTDHNPENFKLKIGNSKLEIIVIEKFVEYTGYPFLYHPALINNNS